MTDLIVALDGIYGQLFLAKDLHDNAGVTWFKVGAQGWLTVDLRRLSQLTVPAGKIFLDAKFADTSDTVRESVKRFADIGIAAVSTFTSSATRAALSAGTDIAVWQVYKLTDDFGPAPWVDQPGAGLICPGDAAPHLRKFGRTIVVPGVRLADSDDFHGHTRGCLCGDIAGLADYAVVGRPIWGASDPVAAARRYIEGLAS